MSYLCRYNRQFHIFFQIFFRMTGGFRLLIRPTKHKTTEGTVYPHSANRLQRTKGNTRSGFKTVLICLLWLVQVIAGTSAQAGEKLYEIDISAAHLADALTQLSEQTGVQVLFSYSLVDGKRANEVRGNYGLQGALDTLLRDTGLSGSLSNKGVILIALQRPVEINKRRKENMNTKKSAIATALVSIFGVSQGVTAQTDGAQSRGIEEIIVTAQKREENLQDVPIAISALTVNQITASGVSDTMQLSAAVPGLVINQTAGTPAIFLRGVGTQNTAPGEEGGNAVYVDGVYLANTRAMIFDFNNIERIEVLKGPQGTLFGRNATGGLIHVITRNPSHEPVFKTSVGYGNYDKITATAYGSIGLSDTVAIDMALNYMDQRDGFGTNLLYGNDIYRGDEWGVRTKLLWTPNDEAKITLAADHMESVLGFNTPRQPIPGAVGTTGTTYSGNRYDVASTEYFPRAPYRGSGVSARIDYDLGWADFMSLTAYRESQAGQFYDLDGEAAPLINVLYDNPYDQLTQEFQLQAGPDARFHWIVGVFYMDSSTETKPVSTNGLAFAAQGGDLSRYVNYDTDSIAVFAQITYPVTDSTNVTAGVRYTEDERHFKGYMLAPAIPGPFNQVDDSSDDNKVTYKLAIDHSLTDDFMIFGSISRGFKSGVYNTTAFPSPAVEPEVIDAYEVGIKSELLDNRLRLNLSGYFYDYQDIQLNQVLPGAINYLFNAAEAEYYGIDLELTAVPTDNLTIRAALNWMHGEYTDFPGAPATLPNAITVAPADWNCPAANPSGGGNRSCVIPNAKGYDTIRTPEISGSIAIEYAYPTTFGTVMASASYYYNDGYAIEVDNRTRQDSYEQVAAQLGWRSANERFGVSLWGRNLTDEAIYVNISTSAADNGTYQPPRTYGITFDYNYE